MTTRLTRSPLVAAGACAALFLSGRALPAPFGSGVLRPGAGGGGAGPLGESRSSLSGAGERGGSLPGGRLSINVVERPLGAVLDFISRNSGYSIVTIPDSIRHDVKVTIRLDNVYWRTALDVIADKYDLEINEDELRARVLKISKPKQVFFDFPKPTDVRAVINMIAVQADASVVIPESVSGTVTVSIRNVPWRDALEIVARAAGCVVVSEKRGVIRIAKPEELQAQMETRVFQLGYIQAGGSGYRATIESDVAERIKRKEGEGALSLKEVLEKVKSKNGTVAPLQGSNSLIVTDTPQKLEVMQDLINQLDRPPKQVHLSLKLIELSDSDAEEIGILWQNGITAEASGMSFSTMFPFSPGSASLPFSGTVPGDMGVYVPEDTSGTLLGGSGLAIEDDIGQLTLGTLSFTKLTALLQFIRTQTTGRIIMAPQLIALDHEEATIHVGELVRYAESFVSTTEGGGQASGFKEASKSPVRLGIQVLVIPHVTGPDNNVILTVIPQTESAKGASLFEVFEGGSLGQLKLPQTQQRTVVTKMMLRDRETGIIAGLRQQSYGETVTKIPFLGDIPIIGWLFRHRSRPRETNRNSTLLILITPTVHDFEKKSGVEEMVKSAREELGTGFSLEDELPPQVGPGGGGGGAGPR